MFSSLRDAFKSLFQPAAELPYEQCLVVFSREALNYASARDFDPAIRVMDDCTALMIAVSHDRDGGMTQYVLSTPGTDVNARDVNGASVMDYAIYNFSQYKIDEDTSSFRVIALLAATRPEFLNEPVRSVDDGAIISASPAAFFEEYRRNIVISNHTDNRSVQDGTVNFVRQDTARTIPVRVENPHFGLLGLLLPPTIETIHVHPTVPMTPDEIYKPYMAQAEAGLRSVRPQTPGLTP